MTLISPSAENHSRKSSMQRSAWLPTDTPQFTATPLLIQARTTFTEIPRRLITAISPVSVPKGWSGICTSLFFRL